MLVFFDLIMVKTYLLQSKKSLSAQ